MIKNKNTTIKERKKIIWNIMEERQWLNFGYYGKWPWLISRDRNGPLWTLRRPFSLSLSLALSLDRSLDRRVAASVATWYFRGFSVDDDYCACARMAWCVTTNIYIGLKLVMLRVVLLPHANDSSQSARLLWHVDSSASVVMPVVTPLST